MERKNGIIGVFLVHELSCGIGGMETHQRAFINSYTNHGLLHPVYFDYIIENKAGVIVLTYRLNDVCINRKVFENLIALISYLKRETSNHMVFFMNDGWWIDYIDELKNAFSNCSFCMRLGGNDAELAPWNRGTFSYRQRKSFWKDIINKMDYIIANSDYSISRLVKMGINPLIIKKIRGGVNESICNECLLEKQQLRLNIVKKHKIRQQYILVFASRFVDFKGIIPALRCFNDSNAKKNSHILFVGSGKLESDIREWCFSNLKNDQYTFLGEMSNENTIRVIASSDILVNASLEFPTHSGDGNYIHTETMGRSMMEAISVGTQILATDVGGTNEIFEENSGIGLLVPPESAAIINAFNNLNLILNVRTKSIHDYGWTSVFKQYDNIFSKIVYDY